MAYQSLPLFSGRAAYEYNIVIDSRSYRFVFQWMNRHGSWYLSIYANDRTPIRVGIRLIIGWPLTIRSVANPDLFDGMLMCNRTDDLSREPTLEDMGNNIELWLVTDDDIPSGLGPTGSLNNTGFSRNVIVEAA